MHALVSSVPETYPSNLKTDMKKAFNILHNMKPSELRDVNMCVQKLSLIPPKTDDALFTQSIP